MFKVESLYYKTVAFVRKDYTIESTYKLTVLIIFLNSLFPIFSFFFIGKLIGDTGYLEKYGGDYFAFALIGIAFTNYFLLAVNTFSGSVRGSQSTGTLEAMLCSATKVNWLVIMAAVYSFLSSGIQLILMFILAYILLDLSFAQVNWLAVIVSLVLSLTAFIGMGIFSAAGTIIFKKGEPFSWLFSGLSVLVGGAYFPVEIMPEWLQVVAYLIPVSHALDALRLAAMQNYSVAMLSHQLLVLLLMGSILLPSSLFFFNWAIEKGKRDGTLFAD